MESIIIKKTSAFAAATIRGDAVLGSAVGPLKQWIRFDNSYSQSGQFSTWAMKWGASNKPGTVGKYLKTIGSPKLQVRNQQFRQMRIPINSWRTADPGHLHFWKK